MAGKVSLEIPLGTDWERTLTWYSDEAKTLPMDLTGYTARMDIRRKPSSSTYLSRLTTENGGITLGGVNGTIALSISNADTTDMPPGTAVGQLEMIDPTSKVTRPVEVHFALTQEVTRV
jgi:hypothetical protein